MKGKVGGKREGGAVMSGKANGPSRLENQSQLYIHPLFSLRCKAHVRVCWVLGVGPRLDPVAADCGASAAAVM